MENKILRKFCGAVLLLSAVSCMNDDDDDLIGTWYRMSDFDGLARHGASSFTIGNKGYLVGGYDNRNRLNDCWEYDMDRDAWTQLADFPGTARNGATAFCIDRKGYVGTGQDGNENKLNDFWEYDVATNRWSRLADLPATARYGAVAFAVGGKGYIGCGYDGNYLKDFYRFDPAAGSWEKIVSIGGSKRVNATAFVIDDRAYVCCGTNNGSYIDDFWRFDPVEEVWVQLRDIANNSDESYDDEYAIVRENGVAFVIDGQAYLTCGESGTIRSDSWRYDPDADLWEQVAKFKGTARTSTVAFSSGRRGFIVTGKSGTKEFDDIWELHPYEYDDDDY